MPFPSSSDDPSHAVSAAASSSTAPTAPNHVNDSHGGNNSALNVTDGDSQDSTSRMKALDTAARPLMFPSPAHESSPASPPSSPPTSPSASSSSSSSPPFSLPAIRDRLRPFFLSPSNSEHLPVTRDDPHPYHPSHPPNHALALPRLRITPTLFSNTLLLLLSLLILLPLLAIPLLAPPSPLPPPTAAAQPAAEGSLGQEVGGEEDYGASGGGGIEVTDSDGSGGGGRDGSERGDEGVMAAGDGSDYVNHYPCSEPRCVRLHCFLDTQVRVAKVWGMGHEALRGTLVPRLLAICYDHRSLEFCCSLRLHCFLDTQVSLIFLFSIHPTSLLHSYAHLEWLLVPLCFHLSVSISLFPSLCFHLSVSISLFPSLCFHLSVSISLFPSLCFHLSVSISLFPSLCSISLFPSLSFHLSLSISLFPSLSFHLSLSISLFPSLSFHLSLSISLFPSLCFCVQEDAPKSERDDFSGGQKKFMTPSYLHLMWRRLHIIRQILSLRFDVIFTDNDVIWLQNPLPHLLNVPSDLLIACDRWSADPKAAAANGGFYMAHSNDRVLRFFDYWLESHTRMHSCECDPKQTLTPATPSISPFIIPFPPTPFSPSPFNPTTSLPGIHDQDAFMRVRPEADPYTRVTLRLSVHYLPTESFSGFCEIGRQLGRLVTVHANCCLGLEKKMQVLQQVG
ncbi:unnamed protein product [Closterium sp. NIES-65]|nr:unnamed protein product [Closterium sp. NIES-65]